MWLSNICILKYVSRSYMMILLGQFYPPPGNLNDPSLPPLPFWDFVIIPINKESFDLLVRMSVCRKFGVSWSFFIWVLLLGKLRQQSNLVLNFSKGAVDQYNCIYVKPQTGSSQYTFNIFYDQVIYIFYKYLQSIIIYFIQLKFICMVLKG